MFFPIGWPRVLNAPEPEKIRAVVCNRDKILFAILTTDALSIWYCKPCVPIVFIRRVPDSLEKHGTNTLVQWIPDSSMLVVATSDSYLLFYRLSETDSRGIYEQKDSPISSLRRDSAELFIKEVIPSLKLTFEKSVWIDGGISSLVCIRDELMVATNTSHIIRQKWDGTTNRDYSLDLRRIPFSVDQQISTVAVPLTENNVFVIDIEYSPLVGGFAIVLNNGRAAFLTANSLKFDPNQVQGIWARDLDDATCAAVNHKYRLMAFGRKNSEGVVYYVDETTGALEISHILRLSSKDYPGTPGLVKCLRWTPDSCAIALAWEGGGLAIWSTFGALLLCTLKWDYGLRVDLTRDNPLQIHMMEWSAEGYQLWMVRESPEPSIIEENGNDELPKRRSLIQLDFVKSPLTVNPCMGHHGHLYLQGEDRLYLNLGSGVTTRATGFHINEMPIDNSIQTLSGSKQWLVVPIPMAYSGSNWPIRFTAIDNEGLSIAVAGRTGLAHYFLPSRKWKLFGNETQEKDFIVTGGLLWYRGFLIASSYSLADDKDEVRIYPRDTRLDNTYVRNIKMSSQVLLLNTLKDRLLTFCANAQISIYDMTLEGEEGSGTIELIRTQIVDISHLCIHPACVVSATLTTIRGEIAGSHPHPESLLLNVSGRLLMVQREHSTNANTLFTCGAAVVLASCVENVWVPWRSRRDKPHLTEALWLFCGAHGMRVWLPLFPRNHQDKAHTFMSKRIMLPFHLRIYPLAILFEDAILLGAENDTVLYTSDTNSLFSLPFSLLELTSQVYLHQILRQLIHRNLGYHAWEIARSCSALPYFPHSLELLLHEVLEEEATSKEPIPDAQLPSVVEFIREFPGVWARAVVQCARKTEIALWPYLFSVAGPPKKLLQDCLQRQQLDTAASYLIILQNLEPSAVSRQHATLLLDAALEQGRWELSKDLVRFLRAIDPNDVESPRTSWGTGTGKLGGPPQTPPLSPHEDDLSLVLGTMQVSRSRSYSTTVTPKIQSDNMNKDTTPSSMLEKTRNVVMRRKKSVPAVKMEKTENKEGSAEEFFIDIILQRHARRLLSARRLADLGRFAARLDFHLVTWFGRERDRAAKIDDYIVALKAVHEDFSYPYPVLSLLGFNKIRRGSITSLCSTRSMSFDSPIDEKNLNLNFTTDLPDSGYTSLPSSRPPYTSLVSPVASLETQFPVVETNLTPNLLQDTNSVISDSSAVWRDDVESIVGTGVGTVCWVSPEAVEPTEVHNTSMTGPVSRAEVQLRYLLQLFLEGGCLGWGAVLATILRDTSAMARTVKAAHAPTQTLESAINLRDGLVALTRWAHSECLSYKMYMSNIQGQVTLLNRLIVMKQQQEQEQIPESPSPSPAPSFSGNRSGNTSRSRHSSISHASTTTLQEEDHILESSMSTEDSVVRNSHSNPNDSEPNSPQSTCIIS